MSTNRCLIGLLAIVATLIVMIGCGGGGGGAQSPAASLNVSVSGGASILQAGLTTRFTATVANSTNQSVTWAVNGTPGGTPSTGVITTDGLYTAPGQLSDTTDVTITATSQADLSKSASATLRVFSAPRIGTRVVNGTGEFFDRGTNARFTPRGMNYIRIGHEVILPFNVDHEWLTTLSVGLYNKTEIETALSNMEGLGYNVIRVITDCCGATTGLGNPSGDGLNPAYLANVADFLARARSHHIYVLLTTDDLPKAGGYQQMVGPECFDSWPGCQNLEFTTTAGVNAERKFWQDMLRGLIAQKAPMDALLAFELRNEYYYPPESQKADWAPLPLLPTSGQLTAANGKTYDMSNPVDRRRLMDDSLVYWTDKAREVIQEIAPGTLVDVGFVTGENPYVPTFAAASASTMDFIDGHGGPGEGETVSQALTGWGKTGPSTKPVMFGGFAASLASFPIEADAAQALTQWQVDSCTEGIVGWLLWSWDGYEQDTTGWPHWYATRDTGDRRTNPRTRNPSGPLRPVISAPNESHAETRRWPIQARRWLEWGIKNPVGRHLLRR